MKANRQSLDDVAYTLGLRREHLPYRAFSVTDTGDPNEIEFSTPTMAPSTTPKVVFVFTGQGAQWATMGTELISNYPSVIHDLELMDEALSSLGPGLAPTWTLLRTILLDSVLI